ncbi:MAG TPA: hypothetical protein VFY40_20035 [Blastocatellia bacterium]|nr:hypothetical protein [Blastocatellia bacterium]
MRLILKFYIARPLFEKERLDAIQELINLHLPAWAVRLVVGEDEDAPDALEVGPEESLYIAASEATPVERGLSSTVISGSYEDLLFFVEGCRSTLPPELNRFAVEIVDMETVEGKTLAEWARDFFLAVPARLPVRYAMAYSAEEFDAKNMVRTPEVVEAVGVQIEKALPGLYWLNYFGPPYLQLIGKERLLSAPAYEVQAVADGVFIGSGDNPKEWNGLEYKGREQQVITHLGEQFFFSKQDPRRETKAPDFRS